MLRAKSRLAAKRFRSRAGAGFMDQFQEQACVARIILDEQDANAFQVHLMRTLTPVMQQKILPPWLGLLW